MKNFCKLLLPLAVTLLVQSAQGQDHGHLNIGAESSSQNSKLIWENGAIFATNSSYLKTLFWTNSGRFAGYYQQNITLTALPATADFGGPAEKPPALGSQIYAQIASVQGPVGGSFHFWDSTAVSPTITVSSGGSSTNLFKVSESDGSPGLDPFGHIHGRRFTANIPGIYIVEFRAYDRSTNGTAGNSIHTPSDRLKINFQAGLNIQSLIKRGQTNTVTFGGYANSTFHLEGTSDLGNTNWQTIASVAGGDRLQTLTDTNTTVDYKFYRVRTNQ